MIINTVPHSSELSITQDLDIKAICHDEALQLWVD